MPAAQQRPSRFRRPFAQCEVVSELAGRGSLFGGRAASRGYVRARVSICSRISRIALSLASARFISIEKGVACV